MLLGSFSDINEPLMMTSAPMLDPTEAITNFILFLRTFDGVIMLNLTVVDLKHSVVLNLKYAIF